MHAKTLPAGNVTAFQSRVYTLLQQVSRIRLQTERKYLIGEQIPEGKVSTYAALAKALQSSPRAVGGALRNNPFAPE